MNNNFDVIFHNNGFITFQTATYCHTHEIAEEAALDVWAFMDEPDTSSWDGNEPDERMLYSLEDERLGKILWLSRSDVQRVIENGLVPSGWRNTEKFFETLGVDLVYP